MKCDRDAWIIIFTFSLHDVILLKTYKVSSVCPLNRHQAYIALYACFHIPCMLEKTKSVEERSTLVFLSWQKMTKRSLLTLGVCFWIQQDSVKFCQRSQLPDGTRMQTEDWSLMNPARARVSITVQNKHSGQLRAWIVPKSGPGTFLAWTAWSLALWSKSALELAKDLHSTVKIPIWAGIRNEFPWIIFTETIAD